MIVGVNEKGKRRKYMCFGFWILLIKARGRMYGNVLKDFYSCERLKADLVMGWRQQLARTEKSGHGSNYVSNIHYTINCSV